MSDRPDITPGPPLSVSEATAQVTREQTKELRRQGKRVRRGGGVEAVHDMRVAIRRLRTALRAVRGHVHVPKALRRELRRLAARLGTVRDLDVMLELLCAVRLPGATKDERARLARLIGKLQARRERAQRALAKELDARRYRSLVQGLDDFSGEPAAVDGEFTLAARVLGEVSEKLGEAVAHSAGMGQATPSPVALHRLRIGFKRLRYALDFHAAACGISYEVERKMARGLQDVLGEIHDRDLLAAWLAEGKGPFAGAWPVLGARIAAERSRLMRRFRRLRGDWTRRTRPEPHVAPLEPPRFVNLEVQPVTLRLVTGPRIVANTVRSA